MFKKLKWQWIFAMAVLFGGLFLTNPLQAGIEIDKPVIIIEKVDMEQAVAGSEFKLTLNIRNISKFPGFNLNLDYKVKDSDEGKKAYPFTLQPNQSTTIDELKGLENRTMTLTFAVDPEAQNKNYELIFSLKGVDATFAKSVNAMTTVTVPVSYDITKPILVVKSVSLNPQAPQEDDEFIAEFEIANLSKTTEARNVMVHLEGKENVQILDISNRRNINKLAKGGTEKLTFKLKAKDTKKDNTAVFKIAFDYAGNETENIEEVINLPLPESEAGIGATPWVIVNKYTLSADRVLAGNTVTLKLFIENTNQREVRNVKISLGVIEIEKSSGDTTSGGTVFSPVNSSNSFFVESIPGKTVIEKTVDLYVDPNATAKTYIVPIDILYEDKDGKALTCADQVNIPVTQECKLEILSIDLPSEGFIGQPIPVSAEFVNVGKVSLGNFMVSMEGEFTKENTTYYVGNLDIGISDYFQGTIIPEEEGKLEGMLVFTYIDNNNKDIRVEEPFTLEIMAQAGGPMPGEDGLIMGPDGPMGPGMPGMPMEEGVGGKVMNFIKTKWLNILLFLVIIVEAICIFRIKRKRVNGEFFDE